MPDPTAPVPSDGLPPVARAELDGALAVPDFLATAGTLTLAERRLIVDQALVLLEGNYVHRPLKEAMHAINPVHRLRLLRTQLMRQTTATMGPEWPFHREMISIFMSMRDLHTNYLLPRPFAGKVAYLPFVLEKATESGADHYLVTRKVAGFTAPGFERGAEVTHWNGMPIAKAVELNGLRMAGSNRPASLARGLDSLTIRPLSMQLAPEEDWIAVTYVALDGTTAEARVAWEVVENLPPMTDADSVTTAATAAAFDLDADERSRANKLIYLPEVVQLESEQSDGRLESPQAVGDADLETTMPSVFRARTVTTQHGTFGQIRIFTFAVPDPVAFRDEFVRLIGLLPQNGLIVDVRGNGGGHLHASEFTLQTLTPREITPEPVQFIATPLNLSLCRRHKDGTEGIDLGPWFPSMDQAIEIGATFSSAYPITPAAGANALGQTYHGPAVLITDARCYSATDFFAAGWADHEIGPILGVDDCTGAGGANVWTHQLLLQLLGDRASEPGSPYAQLPKGTNMRVSIRRGLRVGALSGTPVEDLGVCPTVRHAMTRADVLDGNVDLLNAAGGLLAGLPARRLEVSASAAGGGLAIEVSTAGLNRVDLYVDGRPVGSPDVGDTPVTVTAPGVGSGAVVLARGFDDGALVASRRVVA